MPFRVSASHVTLALLCWIIDDRLDGKRMGSRAAIDHEL